MLLASIIGILFGSIFILLYMVTIIGLILVIIAENRNPLKTIPWVIVLLLAPGVGLIFYLFFGQDNRKQRIIKRRTYKRLIQHPRTGKIPADRCRVPGPYRGLSILLNRTRNAPLRYGSQIEVYTSGREKFKALFEDIRQARHHIHIQDYIFADDETGGALRDLLVEKAREGVRVRVLYDDVGCWNVPNRFFREMKQAGIEVYPFLRVAFPLLTSKVNYRNHRKIVVIDGRVGYMGGMNVADRYVKGVAWGAWRDLHFRITGKGVYGLQTAFLVDWYVVSKQVLSGKEFYPALPVLTNTIMQVVTSGPVTPWRVLSQAEIYIITNAKQYVYIQTPYFLPTEQILTALQTAALSGVDVRLMLPARADNRLTHLASCSYLADVLQAGVKIYLYQKGFLHSKLMVSDDHLSTVGSTNVDFRSFEHNFEVNAFIYDMETALQMREIFLQDQRDCQQISLKAWEKRPRRQKAAESVVRLLSPLL